MLLVDATVVVALAAAGIAVLLLGCCFCLLPLLYFIPAIVVDVVGLATIVFAAIAMVR